MGLPKKQTIYDTLNQTKHIIDCAGQTSLFPDLYKPTKSIHAEYWLYSDLCKLYDQPYFPTQTDWATYARSQIVQPAIPTNKSQKIHLTVPWAEFCNEHIIPANELQSNTKQSDIAMSRYACWCMVRRNPAMIFSRSYFIMPQNTTFNELYDTSYQFARVHLRNELATWERNLAGVLKQLHANHSAFNHEIVQRAFFYGYSSEDIKNAHRIQVKNNDPLANYMGPASLYAKTCAIINAINRFEQLTKPRLEPFKIIMHEELTKARVQTIKTTAHRPEQDIYPIQVSKIETQLTQIEQEFIRKYHNIKLK